MAAIATLTVSFTQSAADWLYRKYHRWRLPRSQRHMRSLHPAFRLHGQTDGSFDIIWRGRCVGRTQPLSALLPATATSPDRRSCFIVTSGPSLAKLDLQTLRDWPCIGVNGSIAAEVRTGEHRWPNFRYHVITDRQFVNDRFELTQAVMRSDAQCLLTFRVLDHICRREPTLLDRDGVFLLHQPNTVYGQAKRTPSAFDEWAAADDDLLLHPQVRGASDWVGFSKNLALGAFSGQTVAFSALQIAYALGFQRVYLLGMDLGGGGQQPQWTRFYEPPHSTTGASLSAAPTRLDRDFEPYIRPAFEVAATLCRSDDDDFQVYNLSPDSRLPDSVIPKRSFTETLARLVKEPVT